MDEDTLTLLRLLLARLERISADSLWARRASGLRGALLKSLEMIENGEPVSQSGLRRMIETGFVTLERAAMEISQPSK